MKVDIQALASAALGSKTVAMLRKQKPKMMLIGGLTLIGIGVVASCRGTLKVHDSMEQLEDDLSDIHGEGQAAEKAKVLGKFCLKTARTYAPAIICLGSGVALVIGSHNVMQSRIGMLSAAYIALDESFQGYRGRVIAEQGEEADKRYRFGIEEEEVVTETTNDKGKKVKQKETIPYVHSDGRPYSPYARYFDAYNSPGEWRNDPGYNDMFLRSQQAVANEIFQKRGHLFLNEVYRMLGMAETPEGQLVGWYKGYGDDFVDFGLLECYNAPARDYVNGASECFVLDFNVDGPIWDML